MFHVNFYFFKLLIFDHRVHNIILKTTCTIIRIVDRLSTKRDYDQSCLIDFQIAIKKKKKKINPNRKVLAGQMKRWPRWETIPFAIIMHRICFLFFYLYLFLLLLFNAERFLIPLDHPISPPRLFDRNNPTGTCTANKTIRLQMMEKKKETIYNITNIKEEIGFLIKQNRKKE